jgi:hypothetical protein
VVSASLSGLFGSTCRLSSGGLAVQAVDWGPVTSIVNECAHLLHAYVISKNAALHPDGRTDRESLGETSPLLVVVRSTSGC